MSTTVTMTSMSALGMRLNILIDAHSKVPITTMNMTPTSAAMGIMPIQGPRKRMNASSSSAATMPERRLRPPEFTLMRDWPIMAQPPIPPKNPQVMFAMPWPTHSLLPRPRVSVISSMSDKVISDSIRPTPASTTAKGRMIIRVAQFIGGRTSYARSWK